MRAFIEGERTAGNDAIFPAKVQEVLDDPRLALLTNRWGIFCQTACCLEEVKRLRDRRTLDGRCDAPHLRIDLLGAHLGPFIYVAL